MPYQSRIQHVDVLIVSQMLTCVGGVKKRGCLGLGKGLNGAENGAVDPEQGTSKGLGSRILA